MAVRKGDTQTLALLNGALAEMDRQEPSWQVDLHERYSNTSRSSTLALTAEEQAYLYDTNAGGKVLDGQPSTPTATPTPTKTKKATGQASRSSCSTCWPGARASTTDCWMPTPATTIWTCCRTARPI